MVDGFCYGDKSEMAAEKSYDNDNTSNNDFNNNRIEFRNDSLLVNVLQ